MKSVLIYQLTYHPFKESIQAALILDLSGIRADIFHAVYSTPCGSEIIPGKEYLDKIFPTITPEYHKTVVEIRREKTLNAKKLCLDADYDYVLFLNDDVVFDRDALQLLLAAEKEVICGLIQFIPRPNVPDKFYERILDPEGPQDADDRPIELHKDFEFGDVIRCIRAYLGVCLISKKVFELDDYQGFDEMASFLWLEQKQIPLFLHTGVRADYLGNNTYWDYKKREESQEKEIVP